MFVLALCGYPKVGKDTIAEHLVANHGFVRVAFADPLREALLALDPLVLVENNYGRLSTFVRTLGWTRCKESPEVRTLLQRMGTEAGRNIHGEDCWVNLAWAKILGQVKPVVITDMRFDNEVRMVRGLYKLDRNPFVAHIVRPGFGKVNEHASEQLDYSKIADGTFVNNGVSELLRDIDDFVENCQWLRCRSTQNV